MDRRLYLEEWWTGWEVNPQRLTTLNKESFLL